MRTSTRRLTASLLVLGLVFTAIVLTAVDALADVRITAYSIYFPTESQVGDQNRPFRFTVENVSTDPDRGKRLLLTEAGITPACAEFQGTACVQPAPDVFDLRTGPGAAVGVGGSCVGDSFTVQGPDAEGRYRVIPEQPVVLGPSDASGPEVRLCQFEMLIEEVTRAPVADLGPAPGIQTEHQIDARADHPATGDVATFTRTGLVTIYPGEVAVATLSDPNQANDPMPVPSGTTSTDTATVRHTNPGDNTPDPTGDVFFRLIGPDPDADCTGPVAFESGPRPIHPATGEAVSEPSAPLQDPGLYNWVATFASGDNNYSDITEPQGCGDDRERFQVQFQVQPAPTVAVDKTAHPTSQPEPGGDFTFDVVVTNTTDRPVTITSLTDDVYGDLDDATNPDVTDNTCEGAVGIALAAAQGPGNTVACSFVGEFTGVAGDTETEIVTVVVEDGTGRDATDSDDATVTITDATSGLPDTTVPSWTAGGDVAAGDATATSVTLSWPAATDDVGVVGYRVYQSGGQASAQAHDPGTLVADQTSRTLEVEGLAPDARYAFTVDAYDAAGNESHEGLSTTVTTLPEVLDPDGACPAGEVPATPFTDIARNVHEDTIACILWYGLTQGTTPTTFSPANRVRRDQMASFIARTMEASGVTLPEPSDQGFDDIAGNVHEDRINQLADIGVVLGTSSGTYAPSQEVRRDQMASFLVRAYEEIDDAELAREPSPFTDIAGNTHLATIEKAATAGFTRGTRPTTYAPAASVRRDQMGSFLARLLQRGLTDGHVTRPGG